MSTTPLQALPVELLYRILDNLDARTICLSFRYVCKRFHTITDTYDRYELNFELISKTDFELICRILRPENVYSLILCEHITRPNQMKLFHQLIDVRRFIRLKSAIIDSNDLDLDHILECIRNCSLISFSIHIPQVGMPRLPFRHHNILPPSLSSIIAQSTLQNLYLHTPYQINQQAWPSQCTLKYLIITDCTFHQYCIILQHSSLLKTIVLRNCDSLMNNTNEITSPAFVLPSFGQVISLTLEKLDLLTNDKLELFLSLTPSLVHLQLTSENKLFNEFQWEQFIKVKLPFLKKFQFFFNFHLNQFQRSVDIVSIIVSFKTPFWLNNGWFVTCDCIRKLGLIRLYSIPICVTEFYYVTKLDKDSYSTHDTMNNDAAAMDNVHVLASDWAIEEKLHEHHLYRNVTRFEVQINDQSSIDCLRYLASLIDFSHLVAVKIDIIFDTQTNLLDFHRQPIQRNNHANNSNCNIRIEKVCSMIPRHVKHLDVTVTNIDEMITILTRLNHLYTIIFRFGVRFSDRPQEIIAWLNNKRTDFTYHYEYNYMSIWLGKTITHEPLPMTPSCKRAKILHRYDHF